MKVLFTFGGLPHYLIPILNRLNKIENTEILVAIPKGNSKTIGNSVQLEKKGIAFKVIYLDEIKAFYGKYFLKNLLSVFETEKPNILVTHWPYILDLTRDFKLKKHIKKHNIKVILREIPFDVPTYQETFSYYKSYYARTLNEDMIENKKVNLPFYVKHYILRKIRKYYYNNLIDGLISYTDKAIEVAGSYGVPRHKIFVAKNSQDTDIVFKIKQEIQNKEAILPNNPFRIIHIGRLVKWKRVDLLINAVSILKNEIPEIELIIIGKGKETENLKNLATKLDVQDNVKFTGAIYDDKEIGRYMNASAVYILAGMGGLSINQAMMFGKPVICSIADGTEKHLVKNDYNGYYFKNGDLDDLVAKIKMLLLDADKVKKFGQNSLSIIENEVNVNTVLAKFTEAFNFVLTKTK